MNPAKVLLVALLAGSLSIGIALYSQQWMGDGDGRSTAAALPQSNGHSAIETLPDLRLQDLDGREVASNGWAGHVVVLHYWATWCPPCLRSIPVLTDAQREFGEGRLKVIGIAIDDPAEVARFAEQQPLGYEVLLGGLDEIDLARRLGNRTDGLPYTVVFDAVGRRVYDRMGVLDDERLRKVLDALLPARGVGTTAGR